MLLLLIAAASALASYKAKPWNPKSPDGYPAKLTSEGITIGVAPLFRDEMAAQVFDKSDMVTRGIMPLAIAIFNENDFPIRVEGNSIEVIEGEGHIHTLPPGEVATRIFQRSGKNVWIPQPIPRIPSGERLDPGALRDLEQKFLGSRVVRPHDRAGGFLYLHPPVLKDIPQYLAKARVYIPDVYREDTGNKMIFFEIDLKAATDNSPGK